MVTKSSREMQKDREKIRPPFGGLKFCQGTHYLPLTLHMLNCLRDIKTSLLWMIPLSSHIKNFKAIHDKPISSHGKMPYYYFR